MNTKRWGLAMFIHHHSQNMIRISDQYQYRRDIGFTDLEGALQDANERMYEEIQKRKIFESVLNNLEEREELD